MSICYRNRPVMAPRSPTTAFVAFVLYTSLLFSADAAKDAAGCRGKPPPVSSSMLTQCKTVIVGGGPGGLFAAFFLRSLGPDVCVVEASSTTGGKAAPVLVPKPDGSIQSFPGCPMRINEAQTPIRCLAYKMNQTTYESDFESLVYTRGMWSRGNQGFVGKVFSFNSSLDDLETAMYEYAFLGTRAAHPLTGVARPASLDCSKYATVGQYLTDAVGSEGFAFLLASTSFRVDYKMPLDVCGYIEYFKVDWDRCCTNFYPQNGFSGFMEALRVRAVAAGVRFFTDSAVTCLYKATGGGRDSDSYVALTADGLGFEAADRLLLAAGTALAKLGGPLGRALAADPQFDALLPVESFKYGAVWPERFWDAYSRQEYKNFRVVTDGRCSVRSEFGVAPRFGQAATNATRPIYVDDPVCVAQWKALYAAGGIEAVREALRSDLASIFKEVDIPQPTVDYVKNVENAWHYLKPFSSLKNITIDSVETWAMNPLGEAGMCVTSEAVNLRNSGWAHAAWVSVINCLKEKFLDMVPGLAEEIEFYESGCNNHSLPFPNEVYMPATMMPATPLNGLIDNGEASGRKRLERRRAMQASQQQTPSQQQQQEEQRGQQQQCAVQTSCEHVPSAATANSHGPLEGYASRYHI